MKPKVAAIFSIIFLMTLSKLSLSQSLKRTVKDFTLILIDKKTNRDECIKKLKPIIDPTANVDSICLDYYEYWKKNFDNNSYPLSTKIESIKIDSTANATVLISNIWHLSTGEKCYFKSETNWIERNQRWYRSAEPGKIIERRKID
ncbi:MAG: hypothetical protein ABI723_17370 [Bacteroidia bacterium]